MKYVPWIFSGGKKSDKNGRSSWYSIEEGSLLFLTAEERGVSGIAIFIVEALDAHVWESSMYVQRLREVSHEIVDGVNVTTLNSIRVKSCHRRPTLFLCHSRWRLPGDYAAREMLRRDTALSVNSASIRYDNYIYIAFRGTLHRLIFQNVREKYENFKSISSISIDPLSAFRVTP